jgi:glycosyltransferase involved in cell wall biosynthesis
MKSSGTSVVIPTRNRLPLLREAITSSLQQDAVTQVVVVDDASEDGTWPWLSGIPDPRVRGLRLDSRAERNTARNLGLAQATGDFVLFLDDDDRLVTHAVQRLQAELERRPDAVLAMGVRLVFDEHGRHKAGGHPPFRCTRTLLPEVLCGWGGCCGQMLIRAASLREAGAWNERLVFAEDQELLLRLSLLGPGVVLPYPVLEYRKHPGQSGRPSDADAITDQIRRDFVHGLTNGARGPAERLLEAGAAWADGAAAYHRGEYRQATDLYLRTIRITPSLLASPVLGPTLVAAVARSAGGTLLGRRGAGTVKRVKAAMRHRPAGR